MPQATTGSPAGTPAMEAASHEAIKNPADRLTELIARTRAPVCVGIDPVIERLPDSILHDAATDRIASYVEQLLHAVASHVPAVKFQSACFERFGSTGVATLERMMTTARSLGLHVILDAKRGDMSISATHYAAAAFDVPRDRRPDWVTLSAYLGRDGLTPFLDAGGGGFALVRTSNPGGDELQNQVLRNGDTVADAVARIVAAVGADYVGSSGYSALGAVVGATKPEDAARLRERMPQQVFLVPGYGVQGGRVDDILPCFRSDGTGAIVTASRSVIFAFDPSDVHWMNSVGDAAASMAEEVGRAVGMR